MCLPCALKPGESLGTPLCRSWGSSVSEERPRSGKDQSLGIKGGARGAMRGSHTRWQFERSVLPQAFVSQEKFREIASISRFTRWQYNNQGSDIPKSSPGDLNPDYCILLWTRGKINHCDGDVAFTDLRVVRIRQGGLEIQLGINCS